MRQRSQMGEPIESSLPASEREIMPRDNPDGLSASEQRFRALSRWDNEGGAEPDGFQEHSLDVDLSRVPPLSNAELVQLQVRTIALENLMIMMLAEGSDRQLELAREMATYISPRAGFTYHPLTTHAAAHMIDLVDRAIHYRSVDPVMNAAAPTATKPYKSTAVFDETTLPAGLRREHRTKPGAWGVIRVLEGRLRYQVLDPNSEVILEPGRPGLILPEQPHLVEALGPMRMRVEFYDHLPDL
jgi:tellurite resistance-related uncharacterized protein